MGILKRVRDITMGALHEVLDQVEDPITMLNQYIRDLEGEILHARSAAAHQVAAEKKWERLVQEMEERVAKRVRQASLAVANGEEGIARRAIADKQFCEAKLEEYRQQYGAVKAQTQQLLEQLKEFEEKYEEMRNKKALLAARANAAQASVRLNQAIVSFDTETTSQGLARMEERVRMLEMQAEASAHMRAAYGSIRYEYTGTGYTGMRESESVEQELARLKSTNPNTETLDLAKTTE
ncbi:PspA/IM30 family protein [Aneurinibacillus sp. Ricciae_BoGa-3]|uniref:PspA/IM30 family protein n=1 Tax=Aneurinibacillus sp. Ricciae_BoGa-3 TaxID=3022697 RepID=UPI00233FD26A|nr:PspA/IM30 family protein [Aneurinibacillus sp. Ricciae_BoGa-3]WCK55712.1 PspA/IM30 family protein [Aneurinibacillus sp. Ricciae_BoGa-3]